MRLGRTALCILMLIILTPCAQIFVRPPAFICAALTIVTVRVTLSGSTVIMARDANSSSLNYRVIFGIIFPCDRAPTSTSLILWHLLLLILHPTQRTRAHLRVRAQHCTLTTLLIQCVLTSRTLKPFLQTVRNRTKHHCHHLSPSSHLNTKPVNLIVWART